MIRFRYPLENNLLKSTPLTLIILHIFYKFVYPFFQTQVIYNDGGIFLRYTSRLKEVADSSEICYFRFSTQKITLAEVFSSHRDYRNYKIFHDNFVGTFLYGATEQRQDFVRISTVATNEIANENSMNEYM